MLSIANQVAPGSCAPAQLTQHAAKTTQPMNQADFQNFGIMMAAYRKQQQLRRQQQQPQQQHQQQHGVLMLGQEHPNSPGQMQIHANVLQRQQSQARGLQSQEMPLPTKGMGMQSAGSGQASLSVGRAASLEASDFRQPQHADKEAEPPTQRSEHPIQRETHVNQRGDSAGKLACLRCYWQACSCPCHSNRIHTTFKMSHSTLRSCSDVRSCSPSVFCHHSP